MKKAAIFDMDGLLFDTERMYQNAWVEVAREFGYTPKPEFTAAICGTSGEIAYRVITQHYPGVDPLAFWDSGVKRVRGELTRHVPKRPGADEIIACLTERGVKMGVASSSDRDMIESNLRSSGLSGYFQAVVSGSEVEHGKPAPDIFIETARQLGCEPSECYVFEDGVNGAKAGIAAGCKTIMVPDLVQPTEEVKKGCAAICTSLHEACELIKNGKI